MELLFPPRCAACDAPGEVLCASCAESLPLILPAEACPRCGAPMATDHPRCTECFGRDFPFSASRSVGVFAPPLSNVVTVYKDAGERRLVPVIGVLMSSAAGEWLDWAEAVVPVPPRPSSVTTRGFDHMRLVAHEIGTRAHVAVTSVLVMKDSLDQRRLGRDERLANAAGSYRLKERAEIAGRILLVDDVFTTGATLTACSATLLSAGADEVRCLTLARATDLGRY